MMRADPAGNFPPRRTERAARQVRPAGGRRRPVTRRRARWTWTRAMLNHLRRHRRSPVPPARSPAGRRSHRRHAAQRRRTAITPPGPQEGSRPTRGCKDRRRPSGFSTGSGRIPGCRKVLDEVLHGEICVQHGDHRLCQRSECVDVPYRVEFRGDPVVVLGKPPELLRRRLDEPREGGGEYRGVHLEERGSGTGAEAVRLNTTLSAGMTVSVSSTNATRTVVPWSAERRRALGPRPGACSRRPTAAARQAPGAAARPPESGGSCIGFGHPARDRAASP